MLLPQKHVCTVEGAKQFLQKYLDDRVAHEEEWRRLFDRSLRNYFTGEYLEGIQKDWNLDSEIETITAHWEDDGCQVFETTGYGMGNKRYYLIYESAGWKIDQILSACEKCGGEDTEECDNCEECDGTGWLDWVD